MSQKVAFLGPEASYTHQVREVLVILIVVLSFPSLSERVKMSPSNQK
jgi:hypothetical protein